jgi:hypothetical protein
MAMDMATIAAGPMEMLSQMIPANGPILMAMAVETILTLSQKIPMNASTAMAMESAIIQISSPIRFHNGQMPTVMAVETTQTEYLETNSLKMQLSALMLMEMDMEII